MLEKIDLSKIYIFLLIIGIPSNLLINQYYDNSWNIGEWLISYEGGFVRRGLPGQIIFLLSKNLMISPILLVHLFSLVSFAGLIVLLKYFCKGLFNKSFLLSQLIILAPITNNQLIRKDCLLLFIYGLCLYIFSQLKNKKISDLFCFFLINCLSIIAIFSHESYGIWAIPSFLTIIFILKSKEWKNFLKTIIFPLLFLGPSISSFILCWFFKGGEDIALGIHQSWQTLGSITPSIGALDLNEPPWGAISAIGWKASQHYFSSSMLYSFSGRFLWIPAVWLLTIFLSIKLFIGLKKENHQNIKRFVVCFQLLAISPLFLYIDYGRWIFMWLSSSALLVGFIYKSLDAELVSRKIEKIGFSRSLQIFINPFKLNRNYNLVMFWIALPECCWSLKKFFITTPVGFFIANIRKIIIF